jgi:molybdate transport system substrate-binding protein
MLKRSSRTLLSGLVLLFTALWLAPVVTADAAGTAAAQDGAAGRVITVFAAASLTDALQELTTEFDKTSGITVRLSFAASSALARQIDSGAPADVFFSADLEWMDYLQARKLIDSGSRRNLLGNGLVLIAPSSSTLKLTIKPHFDLVGALGQGRLATGDPDSVPVGRYARAALTSLGVWSEVEPRLVRAENVRAALAYVDRGEVPLGIVYRTDALIDHGVRIVDVFPADTHPPIVYPIALTVGARGGAREFTDFLRSPKAAAVFVKYGFTPHD